MSYGIFETNTNTWKMFQDSRCFSSSEQNAFRYKSKIEADRALINERQAFSEGTALFTILEDDRQIMHYRANLEIRNLLTL